MKSYLKTADVLIEKLGETLALRELSARAQIALLELHRADKGEQTAAMVAKFGVPSWADETLDAIESNIPAAALSEIALAVYKLSGIEVPLVEVDTSVTIDADRKKNPSELGPNGGSYSGSPST